MQIWKQVRDANKKGLGNLAIDIHADSLLLSTGSLQSVSEVREYLSQIHVLIEARNERKGKALMYDLTSEDEVHELLSVTSVVDTKSERLNDPIWIVIACTGARVSAANFSVWEKSR